MNPIIENLQTWHLHPVADHFTIALLIIGVLMDLVGSGLPSFRWIRYAALTLMILGALAAAASWESGGWEAHKVHKLLSGDVKELLHDHAELGDWLVWVFAILALWRIGVEAIGFFSVWRGIYLLAAVIAAGLLGYQGYLGGELVYDHGVGTALLTPTPTATPAQVPSPVPTVYVPPAAASPAATATVGPSATPSPSASPQPSATPTPSHV